MTFTGTDQQRVDVDVHAVVDRPVRLPAWSRAGAIAAVIASGPTPRMLRGSARLALLVVGSLVMSVGVATMLWTDLGPGPLDVFIGAVRVRTGLSLTLAVWLVVAGMVGVAWVAGRRPGPGTLLSPLIIGPSMQMTLAALERVEPPDAVVVALVVHVAAVFVVGVGAGALIVSGLGAGSGELLAAAASARTGRPEPALRMAIELSLVGVGVALGGPIGIGTVVVALTIGPAVMFGYRAVDSVAQRSVLVADYCDGK